MKRLFDVLGSAFLCASLIFGALSCEGNSRHRGGDDPYGPDVPVTPGEDDGPKSLNLTDGYGEFYGQFYTDDTDNYLIFLYEGKTDDEGRFTGSGSILTLDILLQKTGKMQLDSRFYNCTDSGYTPAFIPSYESKNENGETIIDGSSLYIQRSRTDEGTTYKISGGNLTVNRAVTGQYTITGTLETEAGEYNVSFKGAIDITDKTEKEPEVPSDIDMKGITRVVAEDWGQIWEGIECTDYRDWILYFYDADASSTDEYTCVEILTEEKYSGELPEMKFAKVISISNASDFVPGVIIGGYVDDDNNAWGTWYCKGGYAHYAATAGWLDVKKTEKGYELAFDFQDEEYNGTFKGSYTGAVEFTKADTKAGDGRKPAGKVIRKTSVLPSALNADRHRSRPLSF